MKKDLIIYSIISVITALTAISCTEETTEQGAVDESGIFRLSSGQEAFTRAGEGTQFAEGTSYQLYAIEGTDFTANYLKSPTAPGAVTGKEQADHKIGDIPANKFNKKMLNFYGVTNNTSTPIKINETGDTPTSTIAYAGDSPLTDVMWAEVKNQTYKNSGTITLPFKHTLAKLNLYVLRNEEVSSASLKEITLKDYAQGTLDMLTGKYATDGNETRNKEITVLNNANIEVTTTAQIIEGVVPLVFPTRKTSHTDIADHALQIKVTANIEETTATQETIITTLLAEDPQAPEVPFNFKANHEYDAVITITKSTLVVTIVPRIYDWIPEENIKIDSEINSSMTIGGITWMDRNLGATSGDPLAGDQDWENSRGYFYQFGRNIPYYVKTKVDDKNGITYAPSNGNWHMDESMPYPFIPEKMEQTPKSWSNYNIDQTFQSEKIAQHPTDTQKDFNFIYNDADAGHWDDAGKYSGSNWKKSENHPCPKGWRIPTKNEFQLIIPGSEEAGDIPFYKHSGQDTYIETVSNDPESSSSSIYIGVKKDHWVETTEGITNTIHALKRKGKDNAYFLRWHIERSSDIEIPNDNNTDEKGDQRRSVLVISRYPATKDSELSEDNVRTATNWKNPVEQIKLPISGYIHTGQEKVDSGTTRPALIYSGCEAVYWTATTTGSKSYTVRIKFAGDKDDAQIKMYNNEKRANGCLIRCVRDTKVN